jgi:diaminopimelate epimerase
MGLARQTNPLEVVLAGKKHTFTTIDMGNPHAITFDPSYTESDIDMVAPAIATAIAGGINVEFCRVSREGTRPRIDVTVWERGVGRTLACGTGACAVAAAACDANRILFDAPVDVALPGGILEITVDTNRNVRMNGPARRVFRGEVLAG